VTFTTVISNTGAGRAKDVTVSQPLPGGVAWHASDPDCTIAASTLTCSLGTLAAGATRTVTVDGPTDGGDCGTLTSTASVSASNEAASDLANNSSTATATVNCGALGLELTPDAASISAGEPIGFLLRASNTGAGAAADVHLTDDLPGGGPAWTVDGGTAATDCVIAAGTLDCRLGRLAPNAELTVHVSSTTAIDAACGDVASHARVESATAGPAEALGTTTIACPNVVVALAPLAPRISAGDEAGFQATISNPGAGTANQVTVTSALPGGVAWGAGEPCQIAAGTLTCGLGALRHGEQRTVTVRGATAISLCGPLSDAVTATAVNEAADDDNRATAQLTVDCPDLQLSAAAAPGSVQAGGVAAIELTVSNAGAGLARDVQLAGVLPPGLAWSASPPQCTTAHAQLACALGAVGAGESRRVVLTGRTDAAACGRHEATATASATNQPTPVVRTTVLTISCPTAAAGGGGVALTVPGGQDLARVLGTGLRVRIRCPKACRGTVELRLDRRTARRRHLGLTTIGRARFRLPGAGTRTLTVRLVRAAKRPLRRAPSLRLTVRAAVTPAGAPTITVSRAVTVRRRAHR
jgi:uncharacterized repeat protein (TIGR01451 family)